MYDTILILADTVESSEHDTEKTDSDNLACLLRMKDIIEKQVILPTAPAVSNEGPSSELLALAPANEGPSLLVVVPLFLGPGFRLGARWNRLVETVKTRKRREKTGTKRAR